MKHNAKITIILLLMFLVTQLLGIFVIQTYQIAGNKLPYGMEPPAEIKANPSDLPFHIVIAFVFAIFLFFILTRINAERFLRAWFFAVIVIALGLSLNAIFLRVYPWQYLSIAVLLIAIPLGIFKIYKRNLLVHNITEILVYPGIAAVFVPILGVLGIILLLLAISLYDIWAVWHSGFMQKMAKFQIDKLKIFTGFFIPYASKEQKQKIKLVRDKYEKKGEKILNMQFEKRKIKVNLAILGGGDVIFPIITAGIFLRYYGIFAALLITAAASIGLLYLFVAAEKRKFYPAMPYLTIAMYVAMIIIWLLEIVV